MNPIKDRIVEGFNMHKLSLDGSSWKTKDDFYDALFQSLKSPDWHGRNFNALRDSIVGGQINGIEIPYVIQISGIDLMPNDVKHLVDDFCSFVKGLRSEGHDVDIACK